jgi:hypothetical protein
MRVLVCGGRDYSDMACVFETLDMLAASHSVDLIIHGKATGADTWADNWAVKNNVPIFALAALWTDITVEPSIIRTRFDGSKYNAAAGWQRNQRLLEEGKPNLVVAFPGGSGTADMVKRSRAANVEVLQVK